MFTSMRKLNRLCAGKHRWPFDPYLRRINSSGLPARKPPIIELVNIPVLAISAIFGIGFMVGPTIGPTLGGWITDNYNWP